MKDIKAFTLIELLVVVLIIGILAAVAVPQYQKAVEKSRAAQAISLVKSVHQAVQAYYLANNTWPTGLDELAVDVPWTGTQHLLNPCLDARSNGTWSLELYIDSANNFGIQVGKLTGQYQGTGFMIFTTGGEIRKPGQLLCFERDVADGKKGDYCQKIMKAGKRTSLTSHLDIFAM